MSVTVEIRQGLLRGVRKTGVWGHQYCAFLGIPYAKPPVGPLRFKPPQPAEGWRGVRDASRVGNMAPQINLFTQQYEGDEDCLYLNVYTTSLPREGSTGLLPVLFMVHGGGLALCSGSDEWFGPEYLIQHDLVMVAFNYRLGVLGFLSTGDSVVPGNMGFKDQVMALRWVKENIDKFGGDPNNITVMGGSAGGWSTQALMLSPLSTGLFHKAIPISGVIIGDGACSSMVKERSFQLARTLGLKKQGSKELLDFMMQQPARTLIENSLNGLTEDDVKRGVMFPFVGTVEPDEEGAFFPRHPLDILKSGDFHKVPLMISVAAFEGTVFTLGMRDPKFAEYFESSPRLLVPEDFPCSDDEKDKVGRDIRTFYFGDKPISMDAAKELLTVLGDNMFNYSAVRAARLHSSCGPAVYFYVYDKTDRSAIELMEKMNLKIPHSLKNCTDAGHGADGKYYFTGILNKTIPPNCEDGHMVQKFTSLFFNFMKTGQPTTSDGQPLGVTWPAFRPQEESYLHIVDDGFKIEKRPFKERVDFWDRLYQRYVK